MKYKNNRFSKIASYQLTLIIRTVPDSSVQISLPFLTVVSSTAVSLLSFVVVYYLDFFTPIYEFSINWPTKFRIHIS